MLENKIKIEKGISIPPAHPRKYPFDKMDVGDSFFVPFENINAVTLYNRIKSSAKQYSRMHHNGTRHFVGRILRKEGGIRIWRDK